MRICWMSAVGALTLHINLMADPLEEAARNARQAGEALWRSNRAMHAWLARRDPVTGLLPRRGDDPNWIVRDSAADLYPFLVLAAYFTERPLYKTAMREILRREVLHATRVGRLADDVAPGKAGFLHRDVEMDRIIFGSSEYAKDGLLAITELLGETPWYWRLRGIVEDILAHAPHRTRRGRLPARTAEVNGNMLQVLARLCSRLPDEALLEHAIAIADFYFLDVLPRTGYLPPDVWDPEEQKLLRPVFVLSDHGNEIVGGLAEMYFLLAHRRPAKAAQYREAFTRLLDRLLAKGLNADGIWVSRLNVETGEVTDARHVHCWGYLFHAVYTGWLATGEQRFRKAVERALEAVAQNPSYLFDETGAGRGWGANAYADSLEGALVLLNRVANPATARALDEAARKFFDRQRPDGIVEDWYGDGNFIRTALMYALWKTQGAFLTPWRREVRLGAARSGDELLLHVEADVAWEGRLCLDRPRHREFWHMKQNYPRLNEFPEWFTVEQDRIYAVRIGERPAEPYLGADLASGLPLSLAAGSRILVRVRDAGPAPYGR